MSNPKTGDYVRKIAKGDTQSSTYNPGFFGGTNKG